MNLTLDPTAPSVILRDAATGQWLLFDRPLEIVETSNPADVLPCLRAVETAVASRGVYAAGAVAYEAAPAFDPALSVRPADHTTPLLWFGLFHPPSPVTFAVEPGSDAVPTEWQASVSPEAYRAAFDRIKGHIREGNAYQVDLTYRLRAPSDTDPLITFARLTAAQGATYGAFVSTPRWALCSASPELFFSLDGTHLESRPMKGTAPRGLTLAEDRENAASLQASEKNRAENVMIVDMVRNDLGRVAVTGSVTVSDLFTLEKYPTLWQMTSSVQAETRASVSEIFEALFPAASVTGAPKSSAMRILAETEAGPRRFYTGAAGFIAPNRRAQFNVAIRSLLIDRTTGQTEYGTGGGVVWDSECALEQHECRTKALILNASPEPFSLLETMLWTPEDGVRLLENHLSRLADSAEYFDIPADLAAIRQQLARLAETLSPRPYRLRLQVSQDGTVTLEAIPFVPAAPGSPPLRVTFAPHPVDRTDPFLYHKTTRRHVYEAALASCPGCDDVILWNADGEVTESTRANVVAELGGARYTPPLRCGLLPGTLRQHLIETGEVVERVLTPGDLQHASRVWLANSLRGLRPIRFADFCRH